MTKDIIIEKTLKVINQLPEDKAEQVYEFADFIMKRYEESLLAKGIQKLAGKGRTYDFLNEEDELYSVADLKERYE